MQKPGHSSGVDRLLDLAVRHFAQVLPFQGSLLTLLMAVITNPASRVAAMTEASVGGYQGSLIAAVQAVRVAAKGDILQSARKTRAAMTINPGVVLFIFLGVPL